MDFSKIEEVAEKLNPENRIDITFGFDARMTNPNGDPDNGNRPRQIQNSDLGFMTNGAYKDKLRTVWNLAYDEDVFSYRYQVKKRGIEAVRKSLGDRMESGDDVVQAILENFIDIRLFGSTLTYKQDKGDKRDPIHLGQITGPVQFDEILTVDPIDIIEASITSQQVSNEDQSDNSTFGDRYFVEYAHYQGAASYSPFAATRQGSQVSKQDLCRLLQGMAYMGQVCVSASRRLLPKYILVVQHSSPLGSVSYDDITYQNAVSVGKNDDGVYEWEVSEAPEGVEFFLID